MGDFEAGSATYKEHTVRVLETAEVESTSRTNCI
jgi:hypothetical protein